uniref:Nematode cuticle collagen N-terminal domain-containing protein n=1 Tax=Ascaris lumbricoides TaxID=6252 RepID=A0A9J2Q9M1_ASCLU
MYAYIAIGIAAVIACIALVGIIASEWCEDINEAKAAENDNTKTMELIPHDIFEKKCSTNQTRTNTSGNSTTAQTKFTSSEAMKQQNNNEQKAIFA